MVCMIPFLDSVHCHSDHVVWSCGTFDLQELHITIATGVKEYVASQQTEMATDRTKVKTLQPEGATSAPSIGAVKLDVVQLKSS
eukprot:2578650-Amphidinium_carterae.1